MNEIAVPATEPTAPAGTTPGEPEGDFATGARLEPKPEESELHEGDFAAGERTTPDAAGVDPEAELHGDFAAGERQEPIEPEGGNEGTFADTTTAA